MTRGAALRGAVVALALALGPGTARAEGVPRGVYLDLPDCAEEPVPYGALVDVVRLELEQAGVERVERGLPAVVGPRDAVLVVDVSCGEAAVAARLILRTALGRTVTRELALDDLPPATRARAIALATAEFLPQAWPALARAAALEGRTGAGAAALAEGRADAARDAVASSGQPPPAPAPGPPPVDSVLLGLGPQGVEGPLPVAFSGAAELRGFLEHGTAVGGFHPAVAWGRLDLGVVFLFGRHRDAAGELDSRLVAASIGLRAFDGRRGPWGFWLGPRVSLGSVVARARAYADVPASDVRELYADAAALLGGGLRVRRCALVSEAELGLARGFVATSGPATVAGFGGLLGGARLGLECGWR